MITEMKHEVLTSLDLKRLLNIWMAHLALCERIGLLVIEQLCSAKADVNFWENNWSHVAELCGPSSDFYTTCWCHFLVFHAFWRLLWNGSHLWYCLINLPGTRYFQLSLLECDCWDVYNYGSSHRCLKTSSVRDALFCLKQSLYDHYIHLSSLFLCLLV